MRQRALAIRMPILELAYVLTAIQRNSSAVSVRQVAPPLAKVVRILAICQAPVRRVTSDEWRVTCDVWRVSCDV